MSNGYLTKFNIGDIVWFVDEETEYNNCCEQCGQRLPKETKKVIHRSRIIEINIKAYEFYQLAYPRYLSVDKLFASKEEAEASITE